MADDDAEHDPCAGFDLLPSLSMVQLLQWQLKKVVVCSGPNGPPLGFSVWKEIEYGVRECGLWASTRPLFDNEIERIRGWGLGIREALGIAVKLIRESARSFETRNREHLENNTIGTLTDQERETLAWCEQTMRAALEWHAAWLRHEDEIAIVASAGEIEAALGRRGPTAKLHEVLYRAGILRRFEDSSNPKQKRWWLADPKQHDEVRHRVNTKRLSAVTPRSPRIS
jgi:hypothetical protein